MSGIKYNDVLERELAYEKAHQTFNGTRYVELQFVNKVIRELEDKITDLESELVELRNFQEKGEILCKGIVH